MRLIIVLFLFSVVFSAPVPTLLPNPNNSKPELVNVYSRIVDITVLSMGDPQNLSTLRTFPMDDCSDLESVYFTLTSKNSNETPSLNLPNVVWRGFNPMQKKLALQAEVTILGPDRIRPLMTDAFLKVNILTVLPLAKAKLQRISEIEEEDAAPNLTDKAGSSSSNGERRDKYLEAAWLSSCPFRRTLIRKAAARLPMSIICERPTSTFKMVLILRILGAVGDMTIWRPSFGRLFEYTGIKVGAWDAAFTDQTAIKCEVPEKSSAINDESHSRQMSWTKNVILQTIDNQVGPSALQILPHDETFELKEWQVLNLNEKKTLLRAEIIIADFENVQPLLTAAQLMFTVKIVDNDNCKDSQQSLDAEWRALHASKRSLLLQLSTFNCELEKKTRVLQWILTCKILGVVKKTIACNVP